MSKQNWNLFSKVKLHMLAKLNQVQSRQHWCFCRIFVSKFSYVQYNYFQNISLDIRLMPLKGNNIKYFSSGIWKVKHQNVFQVFMSSTFQVQFEFTPKSTEDWQWFWGKNLSICLFLHMWQWRIKFWTKLFCQIFCGNISRNGFIECHVILCQRINSKMLK